MPGTDLHRASLYTSCMVGPQAVGVAPLADAVQWAKDMVSPSFRFELRRVLGRLQSQVALARFWRWECVRLLGDESFEVVYLGREEERHHACRILGLGSSAATGGGRAAMRSPRGLLVSEVPFPGALRVPRDVNMVVPLDRPLKDIVAKYDKQLRRRLLKQLPGLEVRQVTEDTEIERLYREMLVPFARARHGDGAHNFPIDFVRRMALARGRLDLVLLDGVEVSCELGYGMAHAGKRYWVALRFGCPEVVFSDPRRLRDTNSLSNFACLIRSLEDGFDFYDMGYCLPRFDDQNLHWKRRRGGALETFRNGGFYFVRLPRESQARLLWDSPLFSLEHDGLSLRLGLPEGPGDEEIVLRYREIGFGGLTRVYLHCARSASDGLLRALRSRYERFPNPPELVVLATS